MGLNYRMLQLLLYFVAMPFVMVVYGMCMFFHFLLEVHLINPHYSTTFCSISIIFAYYFIPSFQWESTQSGIPRGKNFPVPISQWVDVGCVYSLC